MTKREGNLLGDAALRSMTWAFVGVIFGTLLVVMSGLIDSLQLGVPTVMPATALAAVVGVLFYGGMELAVLASAASLIASAGFILLTPGLNAPLSVVAVASLAGVIVGAYYGHTSKDAHVRRTGLKFLCGLAAGLAAAGVLLVIRKFAGSMPLYLEAGILCAGTGGFYVSLLPLLSRRIAWNLPVIANGILAGGFVAGFFGLCVWLAAGEIISQVSGETAQLLDAIHRDLPMAAAGAAVGAAIGGFIDSLLELDWQDI